MPKCFYCGLSQEEAPTLGIPMRRFIVLMIAVLPALVVAQVKNGTYGGNLNCGPVLLGASSSGFIERVTLVVEGSTVNWSRVSPIYQEVGSATLNSSNNFSLDAYGNYTIAARNFDRWRSVGAIALQGESFVGAVKIMLPNLTRSVRECNVTIPVSLMPGTLPTNPRVAAISVEAALATETPRATRSVADRSADLVRYEPSVSPPTQSSASDVVASFDCNRAVLRTELAICSDKTLGDLDLKIAAAYAKALEIDPASRQQQRVWLKSRDSCESISCLQAKHEERLAELSERHTNEGAAKKPVGESLASQAMQSAIEQMIVPSAPEVSSVAMSTPAPTKQAVAAQEPELVKPAGDPVRVPISPVEQSQDGRPLTERLRGNFNDYWLWWLLGAASLLAFPVAGFLSKCPKCNKWYAEDEVGRELLERHTDLRTVTRNDQHKDANGRTMGTVSRKEQINVVVSKHLVNFKCKYCNHEWCSIQTSEQK
jgi:uncharacterized protein